MTQIEIHNMLYEHRKNVCKLIATEKMTSFKLDRLYWYTQELQQRINELSKGITFELMYKKDELIIDDKDITINDYINGGHNDVQG